MTCTLPRLSELPRLSTSTLSSAALLLASALVASWLSSATSAVTLPFTP